MVPDAKEMTCSMKGDSLSVSGNKNSPESGAENALGRKSNPSAVANRPSLVTTITSFAIVVAPNKEFEPVGT